MILCVPGFLGTESDFQWLKEPHAVVPLFREPLGNTLEEAAHALCDRARAHHIETIIGYSLGGRLALHALTLSDSPFTKAIIISANPGLKTEAERTIRREADELWAQRFESEPWEVVRAAWNTQTVLSKSTAPERDGTAYDRNLLVNALRGWSLGAQDDLVPKLRKTRAQVLWVTGEEDPKFTAIAQEVSSQMPGTTHIVIPGASHRVMHDTPNDLAALVSRWI